MATIIGTDPAALKRVTCRKCASIIEYAPADTREVRETDYTGSTDIVTRLDCPKCRASIAVGSR